MGPPWWARFRRHGLRLTSPREAILNVISENPPHLSADEVFFLVRKRCPAIGLATVYRTLELLTQMGILKKYDFGEGRSRYELSSEDESDHHHHLVCTKCGKIVDYSEFMIQEVEFIKQLEAELSRRHNFSIDSHQIYFYGLCPECQ